MADTEDDGFRPEVWAYAGQRYASGKIANVWVDPEGVELYYGPKMTAIGVGSYYEVQVLRQGDNTRARLDTKYLAREDVHPRAAEWQNLHRAAKAQQEMDRAEKRAGQFAELTEALEPLKVIARKCRSRQQRAALIATIIDEIQYSAW